MHAHLVCKVRGGGVWQEVSWLPAQIHILEDGQHCALHVLVHGAQQVQLVCRNAVQDLHRHVSQIMSDCTNLEIMH